MLLLRWFWSQVLRISLEWWWRQPSTEVDDLLLTALLTIWTKWTYVCSHFYLLIYVFLLCILLCRTLARPWFDLDQMCLNMSIFKTKKWEGQTFGKESKNHACSGKILNDLSTDKMFSCCITLCNDANVTYQSTRKPNCENRCAADYVYMVRCKNGKGTPCGGGMQSLWTSKVFVYVISCYAYL